VSPATESVKKGSAERGTPRYHRAMNMTPKRHPVTCELDGKTYQGTYWVAGKIMTVSTGRGGKSHQIGALPNELLAKQLLGAMAKAGKA